MSRRLEFISSLLKAFPGALSSPDRDSLDLIHLEIAGFRDTVEEAVRDGRYWYVEKAFGFVEGYLDDSDDDVDNALAISFVEDFALSGFNSQQIRKILDRLSDRMRRKIAKHGQQWSVKGAN